MYILGYSGLHYIRDYRAAALSLHDPVEKRIVQGMDSAACLLYNGEIIAANEEERFSNQKHTEQFPINAIQSCLKTAGIDIQDVDHICHGFHFDKFKKFYVGDDYNKSLFQDILCSNAQRACISKHFPQLSNQFRFEPVEHHLAHAASTFYPSGFEEALVFVADAMGEIYSISVYHGNGRHLSLLAQYDLLSSIGMMYSLTTLHLGFKPNDGEYKVMGLASKGNRHVFKDKFEALIQLETEGEILIPDLLSASHHEDNYTFRAFRQKLIDYFGPPRHPHEPITSVHQDVAAALQCRTEQALLHVILFWQEQTKLRHLCMAGGVALNCVANAAISASKCFEKMYIQPAASDSGSALGAAWTTYFRHTQQPHRPKRTLPLYGYTNTEHDIQQALRSHENVLDYEVLSEKVLCQKVAELLKHSNIVAWVQGAMEFGPRALGHRSILANPCDPRMQERVNAVIKKRESFRPFAPSVKAERAKDYFKLNSVADYDTMLFTCQVKEKYKTTFPAITHVDQSARIQLVHQETHPLYWRLLDAVEHAIDVGMVLNTSFNVSEQAIVCTAQQALDTFLTTDLDALILHHVLITKRTESC
jgi:carbamoyltransferase